MNLNYEEFKEKIKDYIKDYMSEPLAFLFFKFDSKEEMNHVMLDQYNRIYAEY